MSDPRVGFCLREHASALIRVWSFSHTVQVSAQCALASRVSCVCKEWTEAVRCCQNRGDSFEHAIGPCACGRVGAWWPCCCASCRDCPDAAELACGSAARMQYGEYLVGGFGIPRSKVLDSLHKEISLESAARRQQRSAVDCTNLGEFYTTLLSTSGSLVAMAFVAPNRDTLASAPNHSTALRCWGGPSVSVGWPEVRHGLLVRSNPSALNPQS